ncbi:MAG: phosphoesterase, partial [Chloroflexota bacterium]
DYGWLWQDTEIADEMITRLDRLGLRVLQNESVVCHGLQFAGVEDLWSPRFELEKTLSGVDRNLPTVYLCHNPDGADQPGWEGHQGWILSGHTHGGQIKPPYLPPLVIPIKNKAYLKGEIDLGGGRMLYVSRGLGHALHLRLNVRPEITVFTLKSNGCP